MTEELTTLREDIVDPTPVEGSSPSEVAPAPVPSTSPKNSAKLVFVVISLFSLVLVVVFMMFFGKPKAASTTDIDSALSDLDALINEIPESSYSMESLEGMESETPTPDEEVEELDLLDAVLEEDYSDVFLEDLTEDF